MITAARNIEVQRAVDEARDVDAWTRMVSNSYVSTSPLARLSSLSQSPGLTRVPTNFPKHLKRFATEDIKILLLENINETGIDALEKQGYQVESLKSSLQESELIEKIRSVNRSGIS